MSSTAGLRPTTERVRTFLEEQGLALRPWSGLDETYAELYALLNRRKDDPSFWPPVAVLLQAIVEDGVRSTEGLAAPDAELLAEWDVHRLASELRAALPGGPAAEATKRSTVEQFGARRQLGRRADGAVRVGLRRDHRGSARTDGRLCGV